MCLYIWLSRLRGSRVEIKDLVIERKLWQRNCHSHEVIGKVVTFCIKLDVKLYWPFA